MKKGNIMEIREKLDDFVGYLNNSMERNKDQLQDRIQKNEKEVIEKLKRIISTISISASESFLKNNIDEKLHNRLIENSLSELPKKIQ